MNYFQLTNKEKPKNLSWSDLGLLNIFMSREENLDGKIALRVLNTVFFTRADRLPDTFYNRDKAFKLLEELVARFGYGYCEECDEKMPDELVRDEGRD